MSACFCLQLFSSPRRNVNRHSIRRLSYSTSSQLSRGTKRNHRRSILIPWRSLVYDEVAKEEGKKEARYRRSSKNRSRGRSIEERQKSVRVRFGTACTSPLVASVLYGVYLPYGIQCRYIMVKLLPVEASIGAQLLVSREIIEIMGPG